MLLLLLCIVGEVGQAPIPSLLTSAQRVYMVNEAADQRQFDLLARYLRAWGRFELVAARSDADIVLTFARQVSRSSTGVAAPLAGGAVVAAAEAEERFVIDFAHGAEPGPLYRDSEETGRDAVQRLVTRLCEHMEPADVRRTRCRTIERAANERRRQWPWKR